MIIVPHAGITQERTHVHRHPQRCALEQPLRCAAPGARSAAPSGLAQHARADREPNVRGAVVCAEVSANGVVFEASPAQDEIGPQCFREVVQSTRPDDVSCVNSKVNVHGHVWQ